MLAMKAMKSRGIASNVVVKKTTKSRCIVSSATAKKAMKAKGDANRPFALKCKAAKVSLEMRVPVFVDCHPLNFFPTEISFGAPVGCEFQPSDLDAEWSEVPPLGIKHTRFICILLRVR